MEECVEDAVAPTCVLGHCGAVCKLAAEHTFFLTSGEPSCSWPEGPHLSIHEAISERRNYRQQTQTKNVAKDHRAASLLPRCRP
ncbi:hypothetical protein AAFF_G00034680 [Aldrovandia affinis]|uniref:Uncharacterized protein n=1 Tax=Aldrovandia affinis TaxID=143900 RepID=A0AAD7S3F6_9TELE|nr:hypothetical protein AAFF_G00034680 [Aldrovandia affinis]